MVSFDQPFMGRYQLREQVGSGRMSTVYIAQDLFREKELVAVKLLNANYPDELRREFFRRETRALERLSHPHIIRLLDSGWADNDKVFCIVLEYMPRTLDAVLVQPDGERASWCWPKIRSLADALAHAHSEGVIHRDIKPSNILLDEAGNPKLADFGISRLKYELSVGATLSAFWTAGYAAPEQRQGKGADASSDIYSLGALCFHILTGHAPPADGPRVEDLERLAAPPYARDILRRMLASAPEDRFQKASELCAALEKTRRLDILPRFFLVVSERVRYGLYEMGMISTPNFEEAKERIIEEFGSGDVENAHLILENGDIIILGRVLRFICARDDRGPALFIKAVQLPYGPNLERQRSRGLQKRALWEPVGPQYRFEETPSTLDDLQRGRDDLYDALTQHSSAGRMEAERRSRRRDFVEIWDKVLKLLEARVTERAASLPYEHVTSEGYLLTFWLKEPAPDSLLWEEDTPIAIARGNGRPHQYVGSLIEVAGDRAVVSRNDVQSRLRAHSTQIPTGGVLTRDISEALAVIRRQQQALSWFRTAQMANPRLAEVVLDARRAEIETRPSKDMPFFQPLLDESQKEAVRKALVTRDIFLLQGPPGTGKTAVIAEILLQILQQNPAAQVLITSQSNVAVNHALAQVARISGQHPPEMLRLGRPEKIGQGAERWLLEGRIAAWRERVVEHCAKELKNIETEQRKARQLAKESPGRSNDPSAKPWEDQEGLIQEWLEEAKILLEMLTDAEEEKARLEQEAVEIASEGTQSQRIEHLHNSADQLRDVIAQHRIALSDHLRALRQLLPDDQQGSPAIELDAELTRLQTVVSKLFERPDPEAQWKNRARLVRDWIQIFGKTPDFQKYILKRTQILGATCIFAAGKTVGEQTFDWAIVDEAGRATAPEMLIPLVRAKRAILVGDERQLPPFLDEEITDESLQRAGLSIDTRRELEESLFQYLVEQAKEVRPDILHMLQVQYRMHPSIGRLISSVFYEGKLQQGVFEEQRQHFLDWLPKPVNWYSTAKQSDRHEIRVGSSFANPEEAFDIQSLLERIETAYRTKGLKAEVGVISGYSGQIREITSILNPRDSTQWQSLDIEVATVDAFQGRDRDIIIYSTVRSNLGRAIGFLRDRRRINVALSRARQLLIIVGDDVTMETGLSGTDGNPFAAVLAYIREHPEDCSLVYLEGRK